MISRQLTVGVAFLLAVAVGMLLFATSPVAAAPADDHCQINNTGDQYATISNAVENASDGDTVTCAGVFSDEEVVIDSSIALEGESATLTGNGPLETGITVAANNVTVTGFTVQEYNTTAIMVGGPDAGSVNGTTIRNNSIRWSGNGIMIGATGADSTENVTVEENYVNGSGQASIDVFATDEGNVSNVELRNLLLNNSGTDGVRIRTEQSTDALINGVTLHNISLTNPTYHNEYGVRVKARANSKVGHVSATQLKITETDRKGVYLRAQGTDALIYDANISRSLLSNVSGVNETGHEYTSSAGVYLHALNEGELGRINFTENAIVNNSVGIEVDTEPSDIGESRTLYRHSIRWNYIAGNDAGVRNLNEEQIFDARLNYWGHSSGPASPADAQSAPLQDPSAKVFADGQGDTVSENPADPGISNVRFAPAIGGKSTCDDTPIHKGDQLHDLVPNASMQDELGVNRDFNTSVEGRTIEGPLTDFVGLCLWERAILPLRADDTDAATKVQGPDLGIEANGVRAPLNRDILAVYDQGQTVPFNWDTDVTGTADIDMFAGEDAQFVVAKVTENGTGDMNLQTDPESGDVTFNTSELEIVHIQETSLDGNAELTQDVSYTTDDGDGVYVTMLVTDKTGDGFTDLEEGATFNAHDSDMTIIGLDAIAVQTTASDVTPQYQTAALGEDINFTADANLGRSTGVSHALIFFDKETMRDTAVTITDWNFDLNVTNRSGSGNVTVEVTDPDGNTETVTMNATDLVLEGGTLTGTLRRDGNETTVESENDLISGQLLIVGDPPMVDGNATGNQTGDNATLTISTQESWNNATYQYAHVASTPDGNFSTNWGTVEMVESGASDIRVTGGTLSDENIEEGETVDVQGTVRNFGSESGTHTVELRVDGEVQKTKDVTLESEGLTYVEFTTEPFDEAGEYVIALDSLELGTVTVSGTDDTTAPPGGGFGGGGALPGGGPNAPGVTKPASDRVVINVPSGFLSFDLDLPVTVAQERAGIKVTGLSAKKRVHDAVNVNVDTSQQPPGDVPALNTGRAGHLYLDITYNTDSANWRSSTFEWQASKATFGDRAPEDFSLYRYNEATGEWEVIETEFVGETDEAYRFTSEADGFSVYAVGTTQTGPDIQVTDASLSATDIQVGESVDVQAVLENTGNETGTFTAELVIDGEVVDSQKISVDAGETQTVTFTPTFDEAASFTIAVNDVSAGTLQVTADGGEGPGAGDDGFPMFFVGLVILFIVVAAAAGFYYYTQEQDPDWL
jgi:PGF-pre-PGF domain-containing protein